MSLLTSLLVPANATSSLWLGPDRFNNAGGGLSLGLSAGLTFLGFTDGGTKQGGCNVGPLPAHWLTYDVELWWTNGGATTGNVVFQFGQVSWGDGDSFTGMTDSTAVTAAAPVKPTIEVTTLSSGVAVPALGDALAVRIMRLGADAADTLAEEAWAVGVMLRKSS